MNDYQYIEIDGKPCVEFTTKGKTKSKVIVDRHVWDKYVSMHSWTAIHAKGRITVKTSISKQSQTIWRVIVESVYDELTWFGSTIDHINNNPLDNRLENLRIFNTILLNTTNISSKFTATGMQYIHKQGDSGYKVHYNVGGKTYYKNFGVKEHGSHEVALQAAMEYRNHAVEEERPRAIENLLKKTRSIEFERGLRDKLNNSEQDEVISILEKYGFSFVNQ